MQKDVLLLGNGINRVSMRLGWAELLDQLADDLGVVEQAAFFEAKPLSLYFEELCAKVVSMGRPRQVEHLVKTRIADRMKSFRPHDLHRRLLEKFDVVMTTNYDNTVEEALVGPLSQLAPVASETRYSLFRRSLAGSTRVWHIHGESFSPDSILLGFDQYAGYLQKIRNYVTSHVEMGRMGRVRSPIASGFNDFEAMRFHSWVDHFLRDHIHIVGLGLDFTEIDLWWLLVHNRRRDTRVASTYFYWIRVEGGDDVLSAKRSLFKSLGVTEVCVDAVSYIEGYEKIIREIELRLGRQAPIVRARAPIYENFASQIVPVRSSQMPLTFKRRGRRRPQ